jgi:hypothetical protein
MKMTVRSAPESQVELDGLRLVGLGKISRCTGCPRYHSLVDAYSSGRDTKVDVAAARAGCPHHYCKPLAKRYGRRASTRA